MVCALYLNKANFKKKGKSKHSFLHTQILKKFMEGRKGGREGEGRKTEREKKKERKEGKEREREDKQQQYIQITRSCSTLCRGAVVY